MILKTKDVQHYIFSSDIVTIFQPLNVMPISIWYQHTLNDAYIYYLLCSVEKPNQVMLHKQRITVRSSNIATCGVRVWTTVTSSYRTDALEESGLLFISAYIGDFKRSLIDPSIRCLVDIGPITNRNIGQGQPYWKVGVTQLFYGLLIIISWECIKPLSLGFLWSPGQNLPISESKHVQMF